MCGYPGGASPGARVRVCLDENVLPRQLVAVYVKDDEFFGRGRRLVRGRGGGWRRGVRPSCGGPSVVRVQARETSGLGRPISPARRYQPEWI